MNIKTPKELASLLFSTHAAVSEENFDPKSEEKINYRFIDHALMTLQHLEVAEENHHNRNNRNPFTKKIEPPFKKTLTFEFLKEVDKELQALKEEVNGIV